MKLAAALIIATAVAATTTAAHATIIDDFSGASLSPAYTQTTLLDQGATRNVNFGVNTTSGTLQAISSGSDGAEQTALLRHDFSLPVGDIMRVDVNFSNASQDIGIMVGATDTPIISNLNGSSRADYLLVAVRATPDHIIAAGFNGTTGLTTAQSQPGGSNVATGLFISRTSPTTFDMGYNYNNGPDTVLTTFTVTNANIGNAIGFYTDMRSSNTIGQLDNLRIDVAPEPASLALLALAAPAFLRRRRN
ncbi:MAG: PEP-CTERM sorting domain-containing protein [Phycisphaerae bacterium]